MRDRVRLGALIAITIGWVVTSVALGLPLIVGMPILAVLVTVSGRAYNHLDDYRQLDDHARSEPPKI